MGGGAVKQPIVNGGEASHPAGKLLKFRKQTTQQLQEVPESEQTH